MWRNAPVVMAFIVLYWPYTHGQDVATATIVSANGWRQKDEAANSGEILNNSRPEQPLDPLPNSNTQTDNDHLQPPRKAQELDRKTQVVQTAPNQQVGTIQQFLTKQNREPNDRNTTFGNSSLLVYAPPYEEVIRRDSDVLVPLQIPSVEISPWNNVSYSDTPPPMSTKTRPLPISSRSVSVAATYPVNDESSSEKLQHHDFFYSSMGLKPSITIPINNTLSMNKFGQNSINNSQTKFPSPSDGTSGFQSNVVQPPKYMDAQGMFFSPGISLLVRSQFSYDFQKNLKNLKTNNDEQVGRSNESPKSQQQFDDRQIQSYSNWEYLDRMNDRMAIDLQTLSIPLPLSSSQHNRASLEASNELTNNVPDAFYTHNLNSGEVDSQTVPNQTVPQTEEGSTSLPLSDLEKGEDTNIQRVIKTDPKMQRTILTEKADQSLASDINSPTNVFEEFFSPANGGLSTKWIQKTPFSVQSYRDRDLTADIVLPITLPHSEMLSTSEQIASWIPNEPKTWPGMINYKDSSYVQSELRLDYKIGDSDEERTREPVFHRYPIFSVVHDQTFDLSLSPEQWIPRYRIPYAPLSVFHSLKSELPPTVPVDLQRKTIFEVGQPYNPFDQQTKASGVLIYPKDVLRLAAVSRHPSLPQREMNQYLDSFAAPQYSLPVDWLSKYWKQDSVRQNKYVIAQQNGKSSSKEEVSSSSRYFLGDEPGDVEHQSLAGAAVSNMGGTDSDKPKINPVPVTFSTIDMKDDKNIFSSSKLSRNLVNIEMPAPQPNEEIPVPQQNQEQKVPKPVPVYDQLVLTANEDIPIIKFKLQLLTEKEMSDDTISNTGINDNNPIDHNYQLSLSSPLSSYSVQTRYIIDHNAPRTSDNTTRDDTHQPNQGEARVYEARLQEPMREMRTSTVNMKEPPKANTESSRIPSQLSKNQSEMKQWPNLDHSIISPPTNENTNTNTSPSHQTQRPTNPERKSLSVGEINVPSESIIEVSATNGTHNMYQILEQKQITKHEDEAVTKDQKHSSMNSFVGNEDIQLSHTFQILDGASVLYGTEQRLDNNLILGQHNHPNQPTPAYMLQTVEQFEEITETTTIRSQYKVEVEFANEGQNRETPRYIQSIRLYPIDPKLGVIQPIDSKNHSQTTNDTHRKANGSTPCKTEYEGSTGEMNKEHTTPEKSTAETRNKVPSEKMDNGKLSESSTLPDLRRMYIRYLAMDKEFEVNSQTTEQHSQPTSQVMFLNSIRSALLQEGDNEQVTNDRYKLSKTSDGLYPDNNNHNITISNDLRGQRDATTQDLKVMHPKNSYTPPTSFGSDGSFQASYSTGNDDATKLFSTIDSLDVNPRSTKEFSNIPHYQNNVDLHDGHQQTDEENEQNVGNMTMTQTGWEMRNELLQQLLHKDTGYLTRPDATHQSHSQPNYILSERPNSTQHYMNNNLPGLSSPQELATKGELGLKALALKPSNRKIYHDDKKYVNTKASNFSRTLSPQVSNAIMIQDEQAQTAKKSDPTNEVTARKQALPDSMPTVIVEFNRRPMDGMDAVPETTKETFNQDGSKCRAYSGQQPMSHKLSDKYNPPDLVERSYSSPALLGNGAKNDESSHKPVTSDDIIFNRNAGSPAGEDPTYNSDIPRGSLEGTKTDNRINPPNRQPKQKEQELKLPNDFASKPSDVSGRVPNAQNDDSLGGTGVQTLGTHSNPREEMLERGPSNESKLKTTTSHQILNKSATSVAKSVNLPDRSVPWYPTHSGGNLETAQSIGRSADSITRESSASVFERPISILELNSNVRPLETHSNPGVLNYQSSDDEGKLNPSSPMDEGEADKGFNSIMGSPKQKDGGLKQPMSTVSEQENRSGNIHNLAYDLPLGGKKQSRPTNLPQSSETVDQFNKNNWAPDLVERSYSSPTVLGNGAKNDESLQKPVPLEYITHIRNAGSPTGEADQYNSNIPRGSIEGTNTDNRINPPNRQPKQNELELKLPNDSGSKPDDSSGRVPNLEDDDRLGRTEVRLGRSGVPTLGTYSNPRIEMLERGPSNESKLVTSTSHQTSPKRSMSVAKSVNLPDQTVPWYPTHSSGNLETAQSFGRSADPITRESGASESERPISILELNSNVRPVETHSNPGVLNYQSSDDEGKLNPSSPIHRGEADNGFNSIMGSPKQKDGGLKQPMSTVSEQENRSGNIHNLAYDLPLGGKKPSRPPNLPQSSETVDQFNKNNRAPDLVERSYSSPAVLGNGGKNDESLQKPVPLEYITHIRNAGSPTGEANQYNSNIPRGSIAGTNTDNRINPPNRQPKQNELELMLPNDSASKPDDSSGRVPNLEDDDRLGRTEVPTLGTHSNPRKEMLERGPSNESKLNTSTSLQTSPKRSLSVAKSVNLPDQTAPWYQTHSGRDSETAQSIGHSADPITRESGAYESERPISILELNSNVRPLETLSNSNPGVLNYQSSDDKGKLNPSSPMDEGEADKGFNSIMGSPRQKDGGLKLPMSTVSERENRSGNIHNLAYDLPLGGKKPSRPSNLPQSSETVDLFNKNNRAPDLVERLYSNPAVLGNGAKNDESLQKPLPLEYITHIRNAGSPTGEANQYNSNIPRGSRERTNTDNRINPPNNTDPITRESSAPESERPISILELNSNVRPLETLSNSNPGVLNYQSSDDEGKLNPSSPMDEGEADKGFNSIMGSPKQKDGGLKQPMSTVSERENRSGNIHNLAYNLPLGGKKPSSPSNLPQTVDLFNKNNKAPGLVERSYSSPAVLGNGAKNDESLQKPVPLEYITHIRNSGSPTGEANQYNSNIPRGSREGTNTDNRINPTNIQPKQNELELMLPNDSASKPDDSSGRVPNLEDDDSLGRTEVPTLGTHSNSRNEMLERGPSNESKLNTSTSHQTSPKRSLSVAKSVNLPDQTGPRYRTHSGRDSETAQSIGRSAHPITRESSAPESERPISILELNSNVRPLETHSNSNPGVLNYQSSDDEGKLNPSSPMDEGEADKGFNSIMGSPKPKDGGLKQPMSTVSELENRSGNIHNLAYNLPLGGKKPSSPSNLPQTMDLFNKNNKAPDIVERSYSSSAVLGNGAKNDESLQKPLPSENITHIRNAGSFTGEANQYNSNIPRGSIEGTKTGNRINPPNRQPKHNELELKLPNDSASKPDDSSGRVPNLEDDDRPGRTEVPTLGTHSNPRIEILERDPSNESKLNTSTSLKTSPKRSLSVAKSMNLPDQTAPWYQTHSGRNPETAQSIGRSADPITRESGASESKRPISIWELKSNVRPLETLPNSNPGVLNYQSSDDKGKLNPSSPIDRGEADNGFNSIMGSPKQKDGGLKQPMSTVSEQENRSGNIHNLPYDLPPGGKKPLRPSNLPQSSETVDQFNENNKAPDLVERSYSSPAVQGNGAKNDESLQKPLPMEYITHIRNVGSPTGEANQYNSNIPRGSRERTNTDNRINPPNNTDPITRESSAPESERPISILELNSNVRPLETLSNSNPGVLNYQSSDDEGKLNPSSPMDEGEADKGFNSIMGSPRQKDGGLKQPMSTVSERENRSGNIHNLAYNLPLGGKKPSSPSNLPQTVDLFNKNNKAPGLVERSYSSPAVLGNGAKNDESLQKPVPLEYITHIRNAGSPTGEANQYNSNIPRGSREGTNTDNRINPTNIQPKQNELELMLPNDSASKPDDSSGRVPNLDYDDRLGRTGVPTLGTHSNPRIEMLERGPSNESKHLDYDDRLGRTGVPTLGTHSNPLIEMLVRGPSNESKLNTSTSHQTSPKRSMSVAKSVNLPDKNVPWYPTHSGGNLETAQSIGRSADPITRESGASESEMPMSILELNSNVRPLETLSNSNPGVLNNQSSDDEGKLNPSSPMDEGEADKGFNSIMGSPRQKDGGLKLPMSTVSERDNRSGNIHNLAYDLPLGGKKPSRPSNLPQSSETVDLFNKTNRAPDLVERSYSSPAVLGNGGKNDESLPKPLPLEYISHIRNAGSPTGEANRYNSNIPWGSIKGTNTDNRINPPNRQLKQNELELKLPNDSASKPDDRIGRVPNLEDDDRLGRNGVPTLGTHSNPRKEMLERGPSNESKHLDYDDRLGRTGVPTLGTHSNPLIEMLVRGPSNESKLNTSTSHQTSPKRSMYVAKSVNLPDQYVPWYPTHSGGNLETARSIGRSADPITRESGTSESEMPISKLELNSNVRPLETLSNSNPGVLNNQSSDDEGKQNPSSPMDEGEADKGFNSIMGSPKQKDGGLKQPISTVGEQENRSGNIHNLAYDLPLGGKKPSRPSNLPQSSETVDLFNKNNRAPDLVERLYSNPAVLGNGAKNDESLQKPLPLEYITHIRNAGSPTGEANQYNSNIPRGSRERTNTDNRINPPNNTDPITRESSAPESERPISILELNSNVRPLETLSNSNPGVLNYQSSDDEGKLNPSSPMDEGEADKGFNSIMGSPKQKDGGLKQPMSTVSERENRSGNIHNLAYNLPLGGKKPSSPSNLPQTVDLFNKTNRAPDLVERSYSSPAVLGNGAKNDESLPKPLPLEYITHIRNAGSPTGEANRYNSNIPWGSIKGTKTDNRINPPNRQLKQNELELKLTNDSASKPDDSSGRVPNLEDDDRLGRNGVPTLGTHSNPRKEMLERGPSNESKLNTSTSHQTSPKRSMSVAKSINLPDQNVPWYPTHSGGNLQTAQSIGRSADPITRESGVSESEMPISILELNSNVRPLETLSNSNPGVLNNQSSDDEGKLNPSSPKDDGEADKGYNSIMGSPRQKDGGLKLPMSTVSERENRSGNIHNLAYDLPLGGKKPSRPSNLPQSSETVDLFNKTNRAPDLVERSYSSPAVLGNGAKNDESLPKPLPLEYISHIRNAGSPTGEANRYNSNIPWGSIKGTKTDNRINPPNRPLKQNELELKLPNDSASKPDDSSGRVPNLEDDDRLGRNGVPTLGTHSDPRKEMLERGPSNESKLNTSTSHQTSPKRSMSVAKSVNLPDQNVPWYPTHSGGNLETAQSIGRSADPITRESGASESEMPISILELNSNVRPLETLSNSNPGVLNNQSSDDEGKLNPSSPMDEGEADKGFNSIMGSPRQKDGGLKQPMSTVSEQENRSGNIHNLAYDLPLGGKKPSRPSNLPQSSKTMDLFNKTNRAPDLVERSYSSPAVLGNGAKNDESLPKPLPLEYITHIRNAGSPTGEANRYNSNIPWGSIKGTKTDNRINPPNRQLKQNELELKLPNDSASKPDDSSGRVPNLEDDDRLGRNGVPTLGTHSNPRKEMLARGPSNESKLNTSTSHQTSPKRSMSVAKSVNLPDQNVPWYPTHSGGNLQTAQSIGRSADPITRESGVSESEMPISILELNSNVRPLETLSNSNPGVLNNQSSDDEGKLNPSSPMDDGEADKGYNSIMGSPRQKDGGLKLPMSTVSERENRSGNIHILAYDLPLGGKKPSRPSNLPQSSETVDLFNKTNRAPDLVERSYSSPAVLGNGAKNDESLPKPLPLEYISHIRNAGSPTGEANRYNSNIPWGSIKGTKTDNRINPPNRPLKQNELELKLPNDSASKPDDSSGRVPNLEDDDRLGRNGVPTLGTHSNPRKEMLERGPSNESKLNTSTSHQTSPKRSMSVAKSVNLPDQNVPWYPTHSGGNLETAQSIGRSADPITRESGASESEMPISILELNSNVRPLETLSNSNPGVLNNQSSDDEGKLNPSSPMDEGEADKGFNSIMGSPRQKDGGLKQPMSTVSEQENRSGNIHNLAYDLPLGGKKPSRPSNLPQSSETEDLFNKTNRAPDLVERSYPSPAVLGNGAKNDESLLKPLPLEYITHIRNAGSPTGEANRYNSNIPWGSIKGTKTDNRINPPNRQLKQNELELKLPNDSASKPDDSSGRVPNLVDDDRLGRNGVPTLGTHSNPRKEMLARGPSNESKLNTSTSHQTSPKRSMSVAKSVNLPDQNVPWYPTHSGGNLQTAQSIGRSADPITRESGTSESEMPISKLELNSNVRPLETLSNSNPGVLNNQSSDDEGKQNPSSPMDEGEADKGFNSIMGSPKQKDGGLKQPISTVGEQENRSGNIHNLAYDLPLGGKKPSRPSNLPQSRETVDLFNNTNRAPDLVERSYSSPAVLGNGAKNDESLPKPLPLEYISHIRNAGSPTGEANRYNSNIPWGSIKGTKTDNRINPPNRPLKQNELELKLPNDSASKPDDSSGRVPNLEDDDRLGRNGVPTLGTHSNPRKEMLERGPSNESKLNTSTSHQTSPKRSMSVAKSVNLPDQNVPWYPTHSGGNLETAQSIGRSADPITRESGASESEMPISILELNSNVRPLETLSNSNPGVLNNQSSDDEGKLNPSSPMDEGEADKGFNSIMGSPRQKDGGLKQPMSTVSEQENRSGNIHNLAYDLPLGGKKPSRPSNLPQSSETVDLFNKTNRAPDLVERSYSSPAVLGNGAKNDESLPKPLPLEYITHIRNAGSPTGEANRYNSNIPWGSIKGTKTDNRINPPNRQLKQNELELKLPNDSASKPDDSSGRVPNLVDDDRLGRNGVPTLGTHSNPRKEMLARGPSNESKLNTSTSHQTSPKRSMSVAKSVNLPDQNVPWYPTHSGGNLQTAQSIGRSADPITRESGTSESEMPISKLELNSNVRPLETLSNSNPGVLNNQSSDDEGKQNPSSPMDEGEADKGFNSIMGSPKQKDGGLKQPISTVGEQENRSGNIHNLAYDLPLGGKKPSRPSNLPQSRETVDLFNNTNRAPDLVERSYSSPAVLGNGAKNDESLPKPLPLEYISHIRNAGSPTGEANRYNSNIPWGSIKGTKTDNRINPPNRPLKQNELELKLPNDSASKPDDSSGRVPNLEDDDRLGRNGVPTLGTHSNPRKEMLERGPSNESKLNTSTSHQTSPKRSMSVAKSVNLPDQNVPWYPTHSGGNLETAQSIGRSADPITRESGASESEMPISILELNSNVRPLETLSNSNPGVLNNQSSDDEGKLNPSSPMDEGEADKGFNSIMGSPRQKDGGLKQPMSTVSEQENRSGNIHNLAYDLPLGGKKPSRPSNLPQSSKTVDLFNKTNRAPDLVERSYSSPAVLGNGAKNDESLPKPLPLEYITHIRNAGSPTGEANRYNSNIPWGSIKGTKTDNRINPPNRQLKQNELELKLPNDSASKPDDSSGRVPNLEDDDRLGRNGVPTLGTHSNPRKEMLERGPSNESKLNTSTSHQTSPKRSMSVAKSVNLPDQNVPWYPTHSGGNLQTAQSIGRSADPITRESGVSESEMPISILELNSNVRPLETLSNSNPGVLNNQSSDDEGKLNPSSPMDDGEADKGYNSIMGSPRQKDGGLKLPMSTVSERENRSGNIHNLAYDLPLGGKKPSRPSNLPQSSETVDLFNKTNRAPDLVERSYSSPAVLGNGAKNDESLPKPLPLEYISHIRNAGSPTGEANRYNSNIPWGSIKGTKTDNRINPPKRPLKQNELELKLPNDSASKPDDSSGRVPNLEDDDRLGRNGVPTLGTHSNPRKEMLERGPSNESKLNTSTSHQTSPKRSMSVAKSVNLPDQNVPWYPTHSGGNLETAQSIDRSADPITRESGASESEMPISILELNSNVRPLETHSNPGVLNYQSSDDDGKLNPSPPMDKGEADNGFNLIMGSPRQKDGGLKLPMSTVSELENPSGNIHNLAYDLPLGGKKPSRPANGQSKQNEQELELPNDTASKPNDSSARVPNLQYDDHLGETGVPTLGTHSNPREEMLVRGPSNELKLKTSTSHQTSPTRSMYVSKQVTFPDQTVPWYHTHSGGNLETAQAIGRSVDPITGESSASESERHIPMMEPKSNVRPLETLSNSNPGVLNYQSSDDEGKLNPSTLMDEGEADNGLNSITGSPRQKGGGLKKPMPTVSEQENRSGNIPNLAYHVPLGGNKPSRPSKFPQSTETVDQFNKKNRAPFIEGIPHTRPRVLKTEVKNYESLLEPLPSDGIIPNGKRVNPPGGTTRNYGPKMTVGDIDADGLDYQNAVKTLSNVNSGNYRLFTADYFIQLINRCNCESLKFLIPILQRPNSGILVSS